MVTKIFGVNLSDKQFSVIILFIIGLALSIYLEAVFPSEIFLFNIIPFTFVLGFGFIVVVVISFLIIAFSEYDKE